MIVNEEGAASASLIRGPMPAQRPEVPTFADIREARLIERRRAYFFSVDFAVGSGFAFVSFLPVSLTGSLLPSGSDFELDPADFLA